jgi:hypothetical protein
VQAEELVFNITLDGAPAGRQVLRTYRQGADLVIASTAEFHGPAVNGRPVTKTQTSYLDPERLIPRRFVETVEARGGPRTTLEIVFDENEGLVRLKQGRHEEAAPMTRDLHDALSTLHYLRHSGSLQPARALRIPQVGGDVLASVSTAPEPIRTEAGEFNAWPVKVRPGPALLHLDAAGDHAPLRMVQPWHASLLEASLVSAGIVDQPEPAGKTGKRRRRGRGRAVATAAQSAPPAQPQGQGSGTGRRRRKRRGGAAAPGSAAPGPASTRAGPGPAEASQETRRSRRRRRGRRKSGGGQG